MYEEGAFFRSHMSTEKVTLHTILTARKYKGFSELAVEIAKSNERLHKAESALAEQEADLRSAAAREAALQEREASMLLEMQALRVRVQAAESALAEQAAELRSAAARAAALHEREAATLLKMQALRGRVSTTIAESQAAAQVPHEAAAIAGSK